MRGSDFRERGQLGVADRAPGAAVERDDDGAVTEAVAQRDRLAMGVGEGEVEGTVADLDAGHGAFSAEPVDHGVDRGA